MKSILKGVWAVLVVLTWPFRRIATAEDRKWSKFVASRQPVVVRTYKGFTVGRPPTVNQMFERDASRMVSAGYEVTSVTNSDQKVANVLTAGIIGHLTPVTITVVYTLRREATA